MLLCQEEKFITFCFGGGGGRRGGGRELVNKIRSYHPFGGRGVGT